MQRTSLRLQLAAGPIATALAAIAVAAALATRLPPLPAGALTLLATAGGIWLLLRRPLEAYPSAAASTDLDAILDAREQRRQHARWFIQMRWIAIVGSFGLILLTVPVNRFLPWGALPYLAFWWIVLVVANLCFRRWAEVGARFERQVLVQGLVDLVVLTGFLNASGGIENPVFFAYLFHVIIAGILLPRRKALVLTATAATLFVLLGVGEYFHVLPHFTNRLFPHDAAIVGGHDHAGETPQHAAHVPLFVLGRVLPFLALLGLSAYLTSLIAERLRRRESQLEAAGRTLRLEHQRLERVVDTTGVGMMLVEPDLGVPWSTARAARWLRLEAVGTADRCPLYQSDDGCTECIAERTFATGRAHERERAVPTGTGGLRYLRHATAPVHDSDGRTVQVVELLQDITDRKALEAEAMHHGKLSALGQMAAGVAHEIGNPLSSLATRLALLERRPEPEYVAESVGLLRAQIDRIRRILLGITLFSRNREQALSVWPLNDVVAETLEVARLDPRVKRVRLTTRLAEPSPSVRGVRDQITQVVLNLLLNAAEASAEGDEVTVTTTEDGGRVLIAVQDRGVGIAPTDRQRLFEPFFSTKEKGTGLGLSICFSLVNAHGGTLAVDSAVGRGSTFTVVLPPAAEEARAS